jgi:hypothetical protein
VSRFPRRAAGALPARRARGDHSTLRDRRVAAVAWAAVEDAVYRLPRFAGGKGRGLRGGTVTVKGPRLTFRRARFARDVPVSGKVTFTAAKSRVRGTITVPGGRLSLRATLWDPQRPRASVRGTLHGRRVRLLAGAR